MTTQEATPVYGAASVSGSEDDTRLQAEISAAIHQIAFSHFRTILPDAGESEHNRLASVQSSAYGLGIYLINQNPYASVGDLILPELPPDQDSEMRRVRKSGVLRANHSTNRLPTTSAIPAGQIVDFIYENRASLEDTDSGPQTPGSDIDATDDVDLYHHNVVKFVRFRYTVTTRNNAKAWLLCCFSGGDA